MRWVKNHQQFLNYSSLLFGCIGLICTFFISINSFLLLIPMGILSFGYFVPFPFINKSLRNINYIKIFIITFVWCLTIVGLPFIHSSVCMNIDYNDALAFVQCFVFIFAITLPFDVRDIPFDQKYQLLTIPQKIGVQRTIVLAEFLLIISWSCFLLLNIPFHIIIGISISHLFIMLIIGLTNDRRKELFYAGWVESTVLILWLGIKVPILFYGL